MENFSGSGNIRSVISGKLEAACLDSNSGSAVNWLV